MTTTSSLDDYLAEFNLLRAVLPEDPGPTFTDHFGHLIEKAAQEGIGATTLLGELGDHVNAWNAEGRCASWDDDHYPGREDLSRHFTAWMCARSGNIQDDEMALLDFGVDSVNDNIHGPGCYRAAAMAELEDIMLELGAEHVSLDLGDRVAFVPNDLIVDLPTWPARILASDGWAITGAGDLIDEDDQNNHPQRSEEGAEAKRDETRARRAAETPDQRTARLEWESRMLTPHVNYRLFELPGSETAAVSVPLLAELGRIPTAPEYVAYVAMLLAENGADRFYFDSIEDILVDYLNGLDPRVPFARLAAEYC